MTWNYYNEVDAYAAQWLRNLIAAGHLPDGEVDERSITDVRAEDLKGFSRCHWFAGIGIWPLALRRAGLDDLPVWTGSCPCQPFSAAGKQKGFEDERHLWPVWFALIAQCRPPIVLGEQVASALAWLDIVSADLEGANYAIGTSDLCAAGFGGAHIRQRLYFVANAHDAGPQGRPRVPERAGERLAGPGSLAGGMGHPERGRPQGGDFAEDVSTRGCLPAGSAGGLDDATGARCCGPVAGSEGDPRDEARLCVPCPRCGQVGLVTERSGSGSGTQGLDERSGDGGDVGRGLAQSDGRQRLGVADGEGRQRNGSQAGRVEGDSLAAASGELCGLADAGCAVLQSGVGSGDDTSTPGPAEGEARQLEWRGTGDCDGGVAGYAHAPLLGRTPVDWLFCRDRKWRPVEPGTFPLVAEAPARVGRLRAYGNALDLGTAQGFVEAVAEALADFDDTVSLL